jgi:sodium transport system ATP-binding protein
MSADAGRIHVDGIDVATQPLEVRRRLGVLPDARGLYPRLTAREHIELFGRLQGVPERTLRERCERLLAALGLSELADRRVAGFSHGSAARLPSPGHLCMSLRT